MANIKYVIILLLAITVITAVYAVLGQTRVMNNTTEPKFSYEGSKSESANSFEIVLEKKKYEYTGKEIVPVFKLVQNDRELDKNEYSVKVKNNTKVGSAKLFAIDDDENVLAETSFDILPRHTDFLKESSSTENTIKLKWGRIKESDGYIVYRFDITENKWKQVFNTKNREDNEFTDRSLKSGTEYRYIVRSVGVADKKEYQSTSSKALKMITLPETISDLQYDKESGQLEWTEKTKCSGYEISLIDKDGKQSVIDITNSIGYKLPDKYAVSGNSIRVRCFITFGGNDYYSQYSSNVKITKVTNKESDDLESKNNDKKVLPVSNILQKPELPTGCEITALTILLNHYGFDVDKLTMAREYLPKLDFYSNGGVYYGADFKTTFPGDPERELNSYGCYAGCIKTAANSYLSSVGSEYSGKNTTGSDLESLLHSYIDKDVPVLIWITSDNLHESYLTDIWTTPEGEQVQWLAYEHCVVLTGYDKTSDVIYVSDPLVGNTYYDRTMIEKRFKEMGKQSLVLSK